MCSIVLYTSSCLGEQLHGVLYEGREGPADPDESGQGGAEQGLPLPGRQHPQQGPHTVEGQPWGGGGSGDTFPVLYLAMERELGMAQTTDKWEIRSTANTWCRGRLYWQCCWL